MGGGGVQPLVQDFKATWMIFINTTFTVYYHLTILFSNFGERVKDNTFSSIVLFSWLGGTHLTTDK